MQHSIRPTGTLLYIIPGYNIKGPRTTVETSARHLIYHTRKNCNTKLVRVCLRISTYLLTPWCRVLLENLTGLQLVKKFPAFHGTRRFITTLKTVRHLSLSWAGPIQSIYPHPTSWRFVLILSTHLCLGLPSGLLTYRIIIVISLLDHEPCQATST